MELLKQTNHNLEVVGRKDNYRPKKLKAKIFSYDRKVHKFVFTLKSKKKIDLKGATVKTTLFYGDKGRLDDDGAVEDVEKQQISYVVNDKLKGYTGKVLMGIYVDLESGERIDIQNVMFTMEKSLFDTVDEGQVEETYQVFEDIIVEVKGKADEAKGEISQTVGGVKTEAEEAIKGVLSDVETTGNQAKSDIANVLPDVKSQVEEITGAVETVKTELSTTTANIATAQSQIDTLTPKISQAEKDIQTVGQTVSDVQGQIPGIKDDVATASQEAQEIVKLLADNKPATQREFNLAVHGVSFISPPLEGYQEGDTWLWNESQEWDGMNTLLKSDSAKYWIVASEPSGVYFKETAERDNVSVTRIEKKLKTIWWKYFGVHPSGLTKRKFEVGDEWHLTFRAYASREISIIIFIHTGGGLNQAINFGEYQFKQGWNDVILTSIVTGIGSDESMVYMTERDWEVGDYVEFENIALTKGKVDRWEANPLDLLPEGQTSGVFIAKKSNLSFDFNDWEAYTGDLPLSIYTLNKTLNDVAGRVSALENTTGGTA